MCYWEIAPSCKAASFSPYDLSDYGVSSLKAVPAGAAPKSCRLSLGNGLRLLSSSGAYEGLGTTWSDMGDQVFQEVFISYSEEELLVEAVYSSAATEMLCQVLHPKYGYVYMIVLEVSLVPGEGVCERLSNLTNTYLFSSADLSCVAVNGTRVRYGASGGTLVRNLTPAESWNAYASPSGVTWDSAYYAEKAALQQEGEGGAAQFRFTFRVSLGDLFATLSDAELDYVRQALEGKQPLLCGGFDLRAVVAQNWVFSDGVTDMLCLSASLPGLAVSPLSPNGETWAQVLAEKASADPAQLTHVLAPLYLVGEAPVSQPMEEARLPEDSNGEMALSPAPVTESSAPEPPVPSQTVAASAVPSETENSPIPPVSTNRDPFWEDLPDVDQLPEETEWVSAAEEEESTTSLFSTLLFLGAGILLFCSVVGAAILFRAEEKKGKKTKKS